MLLALSHVILNLSLCAAAAKAPPDATIALHVQMLYRVGGAELDKTFEVSHSGERARVEFDVRGGTDRLVVVAPKYGCAVTDFIASLDDRTRTIGETLEAGPPPPFEPVVLLQGDAPASFAYIRPTFVIFGPGQSCDKPVGVPLQARIVAEEDRQGYYVWMYTTGLAPGAPAAAVPASAASAGPPSALAATPAPDSDVVALRLRTPTGLYHYIRLPLKFPLPWLGWPASIHFDVTEDDVTGIATAKTDTLLCPKLFETRAG